jgi:hypothetical protein
MKTLVLWRKALKWVSMKPIPNNMLTLIDNICTSARQSLTNFVTGDLQDDPEILSANTVSALTKGVDDMLREAARKGIEALLQGFEETIPSTVTFDNREWRKTTMDSKEFLTRFGEITLHRGLYYPTDPKTAGRPVQKPLGKAWVPLDYAWEMEGRNAAVDVVETLLYLSASQVPKEATKSYNKIRGLNVCSTRVYEFIQGDGQRFRSYVDANRKKRWELLKVPERTEAFVVSMDGGNVCLREPGVKPGRPKQRPGTEAEEEAKKKSCYKNAMVGSYSFYTNKEVSDHGGDQRLVPVRSNSVYTAKMPEDKFVSFKEETKEVLELVHSELLDGHSITKLLIMDGARPLWNYAKESKLFEDYDWLLDFYHASEHLSKLSEALFGSKSDAAKAWYRKWRAKLKEQEGAINGLLRSIDYYGKKNQLRGERQKVWKREKGFFARNQELMNYAIYYVEGLPIGSGPIEAACKTIVKARMCQAGMRWNRESGAKVLNLRVIKQSDQWEDMWSLYQEEAWNLRAA